ncbi:DASS family sodium-coupled anion symporter [Fontimonas sp. SYSU GA230001]|uniref:SLC13 family permease n=1 Tax=Fontimonas sp. SYSU GA230001 TaxID=3142450 RepID=UPI0032B37BA9
MNLHSSVAPPAGTESAEPTLHTRALRAAVCVVLAAATYGLAPEPATLRAGLALFVLTGGLWMTQALPLAVTALLVPVLAALTGLATPRAALAPFAHPVIFLFLGSFALAAALQAQNLDRALALRVMRAAGNDRARAVLLLCALAAALSMWISNTATAAMMLPLALGLLRDDATPPDTAAGTAPGSRETVFVLLALAYSCSIGGMATLIGSPPNAIAAAQAGIGFAQWLRYGLPAALLLWPLMMALLWWRLRPRFDGGAVVHEATIAWNGPRRATVAIFALTVAGWIGGAPLARVLGVGADSDTVVALCALVALVASGCLGWRELEARAHWGVLLLFGGGLALSELMQSSGASGFLAGQVLALLGDAPRILLLGAVLLFVIFLTELVSNTASTALVLPILLPAVLALGLSPQSAAAGVAIAASCAFMLPVATPPNAIVFATGRVPQSVMMRCGLWLNLACGITLTAGVWSASRWP